MKPGVLIGGIHGRILFVVLDGDLFPLAEVDQEPDIDVWTSLLAEAQDAEVPMYRSACEAVRRWGGSVLIPDTTGMSDDPDVEVN